MNPVQFPNIIPSSMDFVAPRFSVGSDTSLGGVSTRRRFGNRQYDGRLTVEFRNIPNEVCAQIYLLHTMSGGLSPVEFSQSFFRGAGEDLRLFLDCSAYPGLFWYFIEDAPPRLSRVEGGAEVSNISVEFAARLTPGSGGSSSGAILPELRPPTDNDNFTPVNRVSSVSAILPLSSTGGTDPVISIAAATPSSSGSLSASDKAKLDSIQPGAQPSSPTNLSYVASTRVIESSTGSSATLPLFSNSAAGLVPTSPGGTTNFLREDGSWAEPPGGSGGGSGEITVSSVVVTYANTVTPTTLTEVNPSVLVYDLNEDEDEFEMTIGFPFQLFGQTYTTINIYSNSFFTFGFLYDVDYGYDSFESWVEAYPVPGVFVGTYDGRMKEIYATQAFGDDAPGIVGQRECTIKFVGSQNYSDTEPDLIWEVTLKENQPNKIFLKILQFNDNGGVNGQDLFSFATTGRLSVADTYTAFDPNINTDLEIVLSVNSAASDYTGSKLVILDNVDSITENSGTDSVDVEFGYLKSNTVAVQNSGRIMNIVSISQADYDNLETKDPQTLYIIP